MRNSIIVFLIFTSCLFSINAQTQSQASISGIVKDSLTGLPLKDVNLYIAKTLLGTTTNENGEYRIRNVPFGRYVLIFSHIAYKNDHEDISVQQSYNYVFDHSLLPAPFELPEIDVKTMNEKEWQKNFEIFKKHLLGYGEFADSCRILNPYKIDFKYNEEGNLLAISRQPIQIINTALGYELLFFMKYFEKEFSSVKFAGLPVFSELPPANEEQAKIWENNRIKAYAGSLRHFLKSIADSYENIIKGKASTKLLIDLDDKTDDGYKFEYDSTITFTKHGFKAYYQSTNPIRRGRNFIVGPFFVDSSVFPSPVLNELYFVAEKYIQVGFDRELDEKIPSFLWPSETQTSWVKLQADSVIFDKQGRYFDEFMIETFGYWAKERLSDMLPLEYNLPDSILINYSDRKKR
ncbi:MAG: carboxypeptidase-like regulatory domain-containing protein [Melioribacteraceae bacterium]|nr:carboxypeptidase-like regulatory domain-containing protein [Melioribacteraceae bacterium]